MASTTAPQLGTAVTARPSVEGIQAKRATRGLVIGTWGDDSYVLVWFPKLGTPAEIGKAVQPLRIADVQHTTTPLSAVAGSWVVNAWRYAKRTKTHRAIGTAAGIELQMAAKAHHEAYKAKHAKA